MEVVPRSGVVLGAGHEPLRERFQPGDFGPGRRGRRWPRRVGRPTKRRRQDAATPGSKQVEADAGGDPVKPRPDGRVAAEAGAPPPGPDRGLLDSLLRVMNRAEESVRQEDQVAPVALEDPPEGIPIVAPGFRFRHLAPR